MVPLSLVDEAVGKGGEVTGWLFAIRKWHSRVLYFENLAVQDESIALSRKSQCRRKARETFSYRLVRRRGWVFLVVLGTWGWSVRKRNSNLPSA
jgi:hypothetical protein